MRAHLVILANWELANIPPFLMPASDESKKRACSATANVYWKDSMKKPVAMATMESYTRPIPAGYWVPSTMWFLVIDLGEYRECVYQRSSVL
jgi:hypothetical protein